MTWRTRLWFGPLAAILLCLGIIGLGLIVPGYSQVRETVSEIGEMDSPARIPFAVMLCGVAACLLVFASAIRDLAIQVRCSSWPAYLIGFMAVPVAGVGIFAYPHPLHNVFGLVELIGYQAPLVLAIAWRREPDAKPVVTFSWIMSALVWTAIILNLTTFYRHGAIWAAIRPVYGLAQRFLFATWFAWSAGLGLLLLRQGR